MHKKYQIIFVLFFCTVGTPVALHAGWRDWPGIKQVCGAVSNLWARRSVQQQPDMHCDETANSETTTTAFTSRSEPRVGWFESMRRSWVQARASAYAWLVRKRYQPEVFDLPEYASNQLDVWRGRCQQALQPGFLVMNDSSSSSNSGTGRHTQSQKDDDANKPFLSATALQEVPQTQLPLFQDSDIQTSGAAWVYCPSFSVDPVTLGAASQQQHAVCQHDATNLFASLALRDLGPRPVINQFLGWGALQEAPSPDQNGQSPALLSEAALLEYLRAKKVCFRLCDVRSQCQDRYFSELPVRYLDLKAKQWRASDGSEALNQQCVPFALQAVVRASTNSRAKYVALTDRGSALFSNILDMYQTKSAQFMAGQIRYLLPHERDYNNHYDVVDTATQAHGPRHAFTRVVAAQQHGSSDDEN